MTAKIKLNAASGGGSFSLQAPSSSANNRVFTLPDSADATLLTSTSATGKILQVVQTVKKSRFTMTGSTFTDITGMSVTITPTAASSKILITSTGIFSGSQDSMYSHCRLGRSINSGSFDFTIILGDQSSSETQSSIDMSIGDISNNYSNAITRSFSFGFLDSPSYSLGNAIVYKLDVKTTNGGTFVLGGSSYAGDSNSRSAPSFLTVKEVAA